MRMLECDWEGKREGDVVRCACVCVYTSPVPNLHPSPYPHLHLTATGYRMQAPVNTPDTMYQLMLKCWQYEPDNRPHFPEIYSSVHDIYVSL